MVEFRKGGKRGLAGALPPPPEAAPNNLAQPETAPALDGRSLRATGRTEQLATRVTPAFHRQVKMIAARDGLKIAELLEKAIAAYERERVSS
jgi:predicted DNA-binding ribbon-helix-helix protein